MRDILHPRQLIPLAVFATLFLFATTSYASLEDTTQATGRCPPGYDLTKVAGQPRCLTPRMHTYRPLQSCNIRGAFLVVDMYDEADRCVLADIPAGGPEVALVPLCQASFKLETKPGRDRCVREEREFSLPTQ